MFMPFLQKWEKKNSINHEIKIVNVSEDIQSGDILFLISCAEIINIRIRNKFKKTLLIHESDLPKGRGWSPLQWLIIEDQNTIPITLLEAVDKVDAGPIWKKSFIEFEGHELINEITSKVFSEKINLMNFAIENFDSIKPQTQPLSGISYYKKRKPEDSEIDINKSIKNQINKIRISDENRYPCFFYFKGKKYKILLRKINE